MFASTNNIAPHYDATPRSSVGRGQTDACVLEQVGMEESVTIVRDRVRRGCQAQSRGGDLTIEMWRRRVPQ
ncbi:hypothetical protein HBH56_215080 [Parastagonospora nodorum]|uniref:Uncharacterized protein n=1 Tax=Phaeosphaeria nodorum (strain SN15 / ATCC MYA-4574 / FGSC 10173) TaxID=321614 RepID=A0A7U2EW50_PHANO|nr:hypothetical protein HBH56_215080 [Parastagonospora nodorum]QRC93817.1 hypothetical protein JI435_404570 [Parastagonospora nodorum SN15]KAH3922681.1 hypothetical protein HBH54_222420 [Parastagonospora nodorum]KAH3942046.1 hypothetical protein HBH53_192330 [Parastagonospora nodorum]KAH3963222.1 hypothetical protein HBH52_219070 [Parastagonospora nodorum]